MDEEEFLEKESLQEAVYVAAEELKFESSVLQAALNYDFNGINGADWYSEALNRYRSAEEILEFGTSLIDHINSPERITPEFEEYDLDVESGELAGLRNQIWYDRAQKRHEKALESHQERLEDAFVEPYTAGLDVEPLIRAIGDYNSLKSGYQEEIEFIESPESEEGETRLIEDEDAVLIQN